MNRNPHTDLERWLAAEVAGDDLAAEEAFGAVFASMPRLAPPPGFTERVIMAFDREPDTGRATWLWKAALAAAVALAGLATGLLPLVRWIPIRLPSVGDVFAAAVGGFEWTTPQIAGTSADLGLLAEYSYDGRGSDAPFTALDNDVFVGARLTFNDAQDTALLIGSVFDVSGGARSFRLEFERRIGANWTMDATVQAFDHAEPRSGEAAFEQDDFVSIEFARHF